MPKIIQLNQHVADLIAAGEVVSRPASVVKELLENAIDAGAGIITVEISSGGMAYIRVTDNGCGILSEDAKTAFLRHATSKLQDASGLEAIGTLGFRGEALAAIAAVSRVELQTRTPDCDEGICLYLEAGQPSELSPIGCPVGTTIIVRDLFFNTPARLKFMKSDRSEGSAVSSVVLRAALSRPDISFRYIKDGKTEYHTPGDSRVDSCIYNLLGREVETGLIPVSLSDEGVTVEGYASSPNAVRGNRSYQFFFVNGRVVRSVLLQSALEQAYKNICRFGRFPACALYITLGNNCVDVNVHPAKTEVRFISEKQVFDRVYYAVLGALEKAGIGGISQAPAEPTYPDIPAQVNFKNFSQPAAETDTSKMPGGFGRMPSETFTDSFVSEPPVSYTPRRPPTAAPPPTETLSPRVIGEALRTYIVVEHGDSVCFIDKHAAHERIHYNALSGGQYEPMSEALISPVICRVGSADAAVLLDNADFLDTLGFTVERFGEDAVAVRHIPADIRQNDVESVLADICRQLERGGTPESENVDKIYKTVACKAAIKAGSISDIRELEVLAARVISGELSHCPHGRPTSFEISRSALEKKFGRV